VDQPHERLQDVLTRVLSKAVTMETLNIQIIHPKAKSFLLNMEEMDMIRIEAKPALSEIWATLRRNEADVPTLDEITAEVELVRQERHDAKK
jgi:hypothetical protein